MKISKIKMWYGNRQGPKFPITSFPFKCMYWIENIIYFRSRNRSRSHTSRSRDRSDGRIKYWNKLQRKSRKHNFIYFVRFSDLFTIKPTCHAVIGTFNCIYNHVFVFLWFQTLHGNIQQFRYVQNKKL